MANKREKDTIDNIVDQLDLDGVTQEEVFGEGCLVKALTAKRKNRECYSM